MDGWYGRLCKNALHNILAMMGGFKQGSASGGRFGRNGKKPDWDQEYAYVVGFLDRLYDDYCCLVRANTDSPIADLMCTTG